MKSSNLNYADILCIAFIILKVSGVINWSWWWVLSPLWISLIISFLLAVFFGR